MNRKLMRICAVFAAMLLAAGAAAESAETAQVDMLAVDHRLYELGYRDGACNGVLDEVTISALKNFQTVNGLEPTGEPNALTVETLLSESAIGKADYLNSLAQDYAATGALSNGSYGDAVLRLQKALKALGYFSGSSDGAYGDETEEAVCRFQLANGLKETGTADSAVMVRLYNGTPVSWDDFIASSCANVGDSGTSVRRLQLWLQHKGYFNGECTGKYGDGTQQAVKRFQTDNSLEASGDLDADTCEKLYWDVNAYLRDCGVLRRGETGSEVDAMCNELALLGYPAHARFNMQTELALMQFQLVNKLKVTGAADEATLARLRSENATPAKDYVASGKLTPDAEGLNQKLARQATSLLGQYSELDNSFGFVQYVALKCGMDLMAVEQLARVRLGEADAYEAGAFLSAEVGGREIYGVAGSEGALIYRSDNGYIVMGYLEAMGAQNLCLYPLNEDV